MKLLIIGEARHGKDTCAEYFRDKFGMTFESSSEASLEIFLFDKLKDEFGYKTIDDAIKHKNESEEMRVRWFNEIAEYNTPDKTRLARGILERTDAYVGMRREEELMACKKENLFDLIIWIDATGRIKSEDNKSCTVTKDLADIIIENKTTLEDFYKKLDKVGDMIFNRPKREYLIGLKEGLYLKENKK